MNFDLIPVEDELFSTVVIIGELHHKLKLLAVRNQDRLAVNRPRATHENREMDWPLCHPSLKCGSSRRRSYRIKMLGDELVCIRWRIRCRGPAHRAKN